MIVGQVPVVVIQNLDHQQKIVVIQNLEAAGGTNLIVSTSYGDCRNGNGINIGPGNATPQWTLLRNQQLYAAADPAAAPGSTVKVGVIDQ